MKPGDLIRAQSRDVKGFVYITFTGNASHLSRLNDGEIGMVVEVIPGKSTQKDPIVKFLYDDTLCMGMANDFIVVLRT